MVISQKPGLHRYDLISRRCLTQQKITGRTGPEWKWMDPVFGNACLAIRPPTGRILVDWSVCSGRRLWSGLSAQPEAGQLYPRFT